MPIRLIASTLALAALTTGGLTACAASPRPAIPLILALASAIAFCGCSSGSMPPPRAQGKPTPWPALPNGELLGGPVEAEYMCTIDRRQLTCLGRPGWDSSARSSPDPSGVHVVSLPAAPVSIANSYFHMCVLLEDGRVYCWGSNLTGGLANCVDRGSTAPVHVELPEPATALTTVAATFCALLASRQIYCWGGMNDQSSFWRDHPCHPMVAVRDDFGGYDRPPLEDVVRLRGHIALDASGAYHFLEVETGHGIRVSSHRLDPPRPPLDVEGHDTTVWWLDADGVVEALDVEPRVPHRLRPSRAVAVPRATSIRCGSMHCCAYGRDGRWHCPSDRSPRRFELLAAPQDLLFLGFEQICIGVAPGMKDSRVHCMRTELRSLGSGDLTPFGRRTFYAAELRDTPLRIRRL